MKVKLMSCLCMIGMILSLAGCSSKDNLCTIYLRKPALWYLATDETSDYSGNIEAYSLDASEEYDSWIEKNTGSLIVSLEDSDEYENTRVLTIEESKKQELLDIVNKKYEQVKKELPDICDFINSIEDDEDSLTVYYDADTFIQVDNSDLDSLANVYNLVTLSQFWQFKGNLENGNEYAGNFILKNAKTGYTLYSLNMDPTKSESASYSAECIRTTNYKDYDGTLEFSAKYTGSFNDESVEETIYTFEVIDDCSFEKGTQIDFQTDSLPVQVNVGDTVHVSYAYENSPNTRIFTSHDQALCFDSDASYEMTIKN